MALSSILPGLREVRAPLLAGYLWLLLIWLWTGDALQREQEHGVLADLVALGEALPAAAVLAAASVAAYLLGSLIDTVRMRLGVVLDSAFGGAFRLDRAGRARLEDHLEVREATARERLTEVDLPLDHPTVRELPTAADILRETGDIRDSLVGEQPERLAEVDRHRSESELRAALTLPVASLSTMLASDHGALWLLGLVPAAGMAFEAFTRMRRYNEGVIGALVRDFLSGRERPAMAPSLLDFEQSVDEGVRAKVEADAALKQLPVANLADAARVALRRLVMRESERAERRARTQQQGLRRLLGFPLDSPAHHEAADRVLRSFDRSAAAVLRERSVLYEEEESRVRELA